MGTDKHGYVAVSQKNNIAADVQQISTGGARPVMREFADYLLSRDGQRAVMQDGKWLPLTGEVVSEQRRLTN